MNQALFYLLDTYVIIYLDNILVFSHMKEDHVHDLNPFLRGYRWYSSILRSQSMINI